MMSQVYRYHHIRPAQLFALACHFVKCPKDLEALKVYMTGTDLSNAYADVEKAAATFRQWQEANACDVCGNEPDAEGWLHHGKGCYVVNEDGGGSTSVPRPSPAEGERGTNQ